ncbi:MAG: hypothetical protein ACRDVM_04925 [Acidimicrobiia bacterium]
MIKTAFLRVYLPVDRPEVARLEEAAPHLPPTGTLRRLTEFGLLSETMADDGWMAEWQGRRFVCPRQPRLRVLEGLLAIRNAYREIGGGLLIPEATARRAAAQLRALHARRPDARSYILTSPWHVPLRWFVPFQPEERELIDVTGGVSIRYRASRLEALERLETAFGVLEDVDMPDTITGELVELAAWLGDFPSEALVELDYGSVAGLFPEADLYLDDSVAEVWESLDALGRRDWETAGEHYLSVVTRWSRALAVTYSN